MPTAPNDARRATAPQPEREDRAEAPADDDIGPHDIPDEQVINKTLPRTRPPSDHGNSRQD